MLSWGGSCRLNRAQSSKVLRKSYLASHTCLCRPRGGHRTATNLSSLGSVFPDDGVARIRILIKLLCRSEEFPCCLYYSSRRRRLGRVALRLVRCERRRCLVCVGRATRAWGVLVTTSLVMVSVALDAGVVIGVVLLAIITICCMLFPRGASWCRVGRNDNYRIGANQGLRFSCRGMISCMSANVRKCNHHLLTDRSLV